MANRKITVNKKLIKEIENIISSEISIGNVPEFNELERHELFTQPPEFWNEIEHTIFDYTQRVESEVLKKIKGLLKFEEVSTATNQ